MFRSVMDQHFIIEMKTKILQCNGHSKVSTVVAGFYLVMYTTNYYVSKHPSSLTS